MKNHHFIILTLLASFFIIAAGTNNAPVKEEFENLQVLPKDITHEQLDSVMNHFALSLGVKCSFCHAFKDSTKKHLDFASDAKQEKETARNMYKMTADINANFFNPTHSTQTDTIHTVICYTCHRASTKPDAKVFMATMDSTLDARLKEMRQRKLKTPK